MAGPITMDLLGLHIDCVGTIATIRGPKRKALGVRGKKGRTSGAGCTAPTTRSRRSRSRAMRTEGEVHRQGAPLTCSDGKTISPRKGLTHTQATRCEAGTTRRQQRGHKWACGCQGPGQSAGGSRRWRCQRHVRRPIGFPPTTPSRLSQDSQRDPRSFRGHSLQIDRVLNQGGRALDRPIVFCTKCGAVYWERADALCWSCRQHPCDCASQHRKLRSGLFPNRRYPGWKVEDVRRPTLAEATTFAAQLESCEAGLGRTVLGPTTAKKQRTSRHVARLGQRRPHGRPHRRAYAAALGQGAR